MEPTADFAMMEKGQLVDMAANSKFPKQLPTVPEHPPEQQQLLPQLPPADLEVPFKEKTKTVITFEIDDEKVPLEMNNKGSLVISPSVAGRLSDLASEEVLPAGIVSPNGSFNGNKRNKEINWEKIVGRKSTVKLLKQKQGWRKYGGIIFGVSASFFFSLSIMVIKVLEYDKSSIGIWRYSGIAVPSVPIILYLRWRDGSRKFSVFESVTPLKDKGKLLNLMGLLLRGLMGCTSVLLRMHSLNYLTVGDSTVISYSGPVFVVIMAHFCLGERCGLVSVLLAVLTTCGVVVITRPPMLTGNTFDPNILMGSVLALSSMFCNSSVVILMRKIREVHFALMLLVFGMFGVVQSLITALVLKGAIEFPAGARDIILTFGALPVLVFCGQLCIILAVKYEAAGPVSLIRSCDVIFAFIWQGVFLYEVPDLYSWIGAVVILSMVALTSLQKFLYGLAEDDGLRKRWRWFLI